MAIAVLHSNDHAGDVVRVISGSYAAKPAYLWMGARSPGEKQSTRARLGRLAEPLTFQPLVTHETTGGIHLVSAVRHGRVSHLHEETYSKKRAILRASATRSMHLEENSSHVA